MVVPPARVAGLAPAMAGLPAAISPVDPGPAVRDQAVRVVKVTVPKAADPVVRAEISGATTAVIVPSGVKLLHRCRMLASRSCRMIKALSRCRARSR